jgi:hypothetical protein
MVVQALTATMPMTHVRLLEELPPMGAAHPPQAPLQEAEAEAARRARRAARRGRALLLACCL